MLSEWRGRKCAPAEYNIDHTPAGANITINVFAKLHASEHIPQTDVIKLRKILGKPNFATVQLNIFHALSAAQSRHQDRLRPRWSCAVRSYLIHPLRPTPDFALAVASSAAELAQPDPPERFCKLLISRWRQRKRAVKILRRFECQIQKGGCRSVNRPLARSGTLYSSALPPP